MSPLSPSADVMPELVALREFFLKAQKELERGSVTNLIGIDSRISKVCKSVQEAAPDMQEKYLPELTGLIELLNTYEHALREFQTVQLATAAKMASDDDKSGS
jgi:hypothetical protein